MDSNKKYYEQELSNVSFVGEYPANVKFVSDKGQTKFLSVNKESAQVIIDKLKKEFNL